MRFFDRTEEIASLRKIREMAQGGEEVGELIVGLDIGGIFLYGVLHFQHGGVFARLGIEHTLSLIHI